LHAHDLRREGWHGNPHPIGPQPSELSADRLSAFQQGLKEAGYVEGRNVAIQYR
jgi:ABC-type uncharacterized transport system substrate-binding protein